VFEEVDDEGDGPVSRVEALDKLGDLLRFIAGQRQSSACVILLLPKD
jgi:hypothetical protein